jgi:HAD superfamily hydrolase (TIGR01509 family)
MHISDEHSRQAKYNARVRRFPGMLFWSFMIQALIFDFDGLILDTETPEARIWQDLYARYGHEFPLDDWIRNVVGATIQNMDPIAQLQRLTGLPLDHQALTEQAQRDRLEYQASLPPLPGVSDYFDSARHLGLRLAVASSSPRPWVEGYLRRLGFYELFDFIFCREDVSHLKPAPDLFLAALSALHLPASQALAFEDSPNGVRAASAAGLRVVGVPNPITERLGPLPADLTLHSLADLSLPDLLASFGDTLLLRPEIPGDLPGVRSVNEQTFPTPAESNLVDLCRQRDRVTLSMVAILGGHVVGHGLFTPVTLEPSWDGRLAVGLGPLAVLPEFQRTGIGSRLVRAGLDRLRGLEAGFVVVLGAPAYYSRFGFQPGHALGLSSDYGDGDEFQVLELHPGLLAGMQGRVRYAPEFAELGC